jgi:thiol-disulfide isomerase/thioredoxin
MLLLDSTTLLSSLQISEGKPLIIFYVRPDCPHCQQETNECISNIKSLKAFEILFLTSATQKDTKEYAKKYHLDDYKNITVGRDFENSFIRVFRPTYVPYIAIYDTQKKLIKIYDGEVSFENIIRSFHS